MAADQGARAIRVFISSTFRDMQDEREELVKRVFPQIRRLCEARGVVWSEVDLRWGVTDEQKAEGAVLPICLAEIERSRPYFIGLLGQRYGWVPDEVPADLIDRLAWLVAAKGRSVTEMEILYGVLNDPDMAGHAYFYLRDPAWVAAQPLAVQDVLLEAASADEVERLGAEAAEAAAEHRRRRLVELKERVRSSGAPVRDYPDPVALGALVLADLTALVERTFPEEDPPDPLDRDASDHAAYAAARATGSIERPALGAALDAAVGGDGPPLVVTGEPGAGTSALLSSWMAAWRAAHPTDVVVQHHVAATSASAEWSAMAARIIGVLGRGHGWTGVDVETVAQDAPGRRAALFAALARAATEQRRTVVLVDGADLLDDADGAPDLTWLPVSPPAAVRVVLSSAGGRPVESARHRGWEVLEVPPLDEAERRSLTASFLGRYSKALDEVHVARLAGAEHTGNVLYLRTILDELRQHGDHFTLGQVIDGYLGAASVDDLLELVLARYERDFERDRPGLVADAFRALWAARHGLTETELLAVLGAAGDPLPRATWSPLFLAAEEGLVSRSGHLAFASAVHRQAVEDRYLPSEPDKAGAHASLARYFATEPLGLRVVDELPWQQVGAGDLGALAATLGDLAFTDLAYRHAFGDLRALWSRAEAGGHRVVDAYRDVVDAPGTDPEAAWAVARLVTDAGYPAEGLRLHRFLVDRYRAAIDGGFDVGLEPERAAKRLRAALVNLGSALWSQGDLDEAAPAFEEAIARSRDAGDPGVLRAALGNLALVRRDQGDLDAALPLFAEEEALCRAAEDVGGLQSSLGNRSQLLRQRGDLPGALALATEQEELCRSVGDATGVARALAAQAVILSDQGLVAEALPRHEAHGEQSRKDGDLRGLTESLLNQSSTLRDLGRRDEAAARAAEGEVLARRLDDQPLLARLLDVQARLASDEGRWADVDRLAREAALTARAAGALPPLVLALGLLGIARRELGDLAGAREAHDEEAGVARQLGDPGAEAAAEVNLAAVDIAGGDLDAALARYGRAEPVLRELGLVGILFPLLANRSQIHAQRGDADAAIADLLGGAEAARRTGSDVARHEMLTRAVEMLYGSGRVAEAEPVWVDLADACLAVGDDAGRQRALGERALLVLGRGDLDAAAVLLDEQELICRRIGDQVGLAACVGNRAILLRQRGDLAGSLACIDEQLRVAKASGNGQGVLFATANRGEVLGALGRVAEGIAALEEARTMASGWNLAPMVAQLDQMLAALRAGGPR